MAGCGFVLCVLFSGRAGVLGAEMRGKLGPSTQCGLCVEWAQVPRVHAVLQGLLHFCPWGRPSFFPFSLSPILSLFPFFLIWVSDVSVLLSFE